MAATNSQVARLSVGDSGISTTGFLSGPEESDCSLSNWITGLFLISKGCELSRGLAWWNQSGSWNRREKNNKSFTKVSWPRPSSYWERCKINDLCFSVSLAFPAKSEGNHQATSMRKASSGAPKLQTCNIRTHSNWKSEGNNKQQRTSFYIYLCTNVHIIYGRSTEGSRGGAHSIKYPVVTLGDYFQILSNELSISVPPPPSQPFQLSNHFYIIFCTTSQGAKAKTNACEKYDQHTSGERSSLHGLRRWNNINTV